MFISKRKWEEMCDRIDRIDRIFTSEIREINTSLYYLLQDYNERKTFLPHTNEVSDITLEELARLVIDGTPITRKVMEENVKEYGRME